MEIIAHLKKIVKVFLFIFFPGFYAILILRMNRKQVKEWLVQFFGIDLRGMRKEFYRHIHKGSFGHRVGNVLCIGAAV